MERKTNWDFMKAVLMLIVVFGHVCPANPDTWTPLTRIMGLFVMPLFFFVSGYFQSQIQSQSQLLRKYKRSLFRIVLPLSSWGLIYVIGSIMVLFPIFKISNIDVLWDLSSEILSFLKYLHIYITGFYWFLTALFICVVFGSILSLISIRVKRSTLVFLFSSISFCMLPNDYYHFSFVWFFYAMGMVYKKVEPVIPSKMKSKYGNYLFLLATIIVICLGVGFYPQRTFYYMSNLIWNTSVIIIVYRYGLSLFASLLAFFWIMKFYTNNMNNMIVVWLVSSGQNTLFIYCSHMLFLEFIYNPILWNIYNREEISGNPQIWVYLIGGIVTVLLYYLLQSICSSLKRFKLCRILFMGER